MIMLQGNPVICNPYSNYLLYVWERILDLKLVEYINAEETLKRNFDIFWVQLGESRRGNEWSAKVLQGESTQQPLTMVL